MPPELFHSLAEMRMKGHQLGRNKDKKGNPTTGRSIIIRRLRNSTAHPHVIMSYVLPMVTYVNINKRASLKNRHESANIFIRVMDCIVICIVCLLSFFGIMLRIVVEGLRACWAKGGILLIVAMKGHVATFVIDHEKKVPLFTTDTSSYLLHLLPRFLITLIVLFR